MLIKKFFWRVIHNCFILFAFSLSIITFDAHSQSAALPKIDYVTPTEYTIGGIDVEGAFFNDKNALINITGFKVGEKIRIPGEEIAKAVNKLWKLGLIGDVKISIADIQGDKVFLLISLKERPRLTKYFFEGIPKGNHQTLSDKMKLVKGRVVTDAMIKNAKNVIFNFYAEKGFNNTEIKVIQQKDTLLSNSVMLKFVVDRHKKVKIHQIKLDGVKEVSEKKIKKKMKKTKEKRFGRIFSPSKYVKKEYDKDKDHIIEYYNTQGYRNATIVRDSVYKHDEKMVSIDLDISEGRKFFYRNINWTGNYKYTSEQLAKVLGIKKGEVYNPEELSKRLNYNPQGSDITSLYMDDGYLFFTIEPVEVLVEGDSIDIEMRMFEGEQANISKIIVHGNTKTNDHVIIRELRTIPGEKFSRADLIRTQRELSTLGYFDPEQMKVNPKPNFAESTVDIEYNLTEKPSDQIELSGGWGGYFGFVGTVGLVFNNFSARRFFQPKAWRPLPNGDGQRLQLRLQANGLRFQTYSLTFTEPWLGGRQANSFSVSLSHSIQRILDGFGNQLGGMKVYGVSLSLGRRLRFPDDYFTMSNSLSFQRYDLNNYTVRGFGNYNTGESYNFNFNTTISRNSIDNPTFPRSGASVTFSLSLTPPYSLLTNNTDFSSNLDRFRLVEYHKWMFDNAWYQQLPLKFVLVTRMHMGFLGMYNQNKGLGPFERFILGGDGMVFNNFLLGTDIVGLRGYKNSSIVPPDQLGVGGVVYNKYVTELRYPLSLNPSATIYGLTFLEAGNNWGDIREFNPFKLYRSLGVGARVFMPAFGMLGVDWAYGLDPVTGNVGANGSQFHFIIGQQIR